MLCECREIKGDNERFFNRPGRPPNVKISQKLKLNSLIVLTLIALNIIVTIAFVNRMMKDTRHLAEVDKKRELGRPGRHSLSGLQGTGRRDYIDVKAAHHAFSDTHFMHVSSSVYAGHSLESS